MGGHNHDVDHGHSHDVDHGHTHEAHNVGAGRGPVMIEVGDGAGALILQGGPELAGTEIEISPVGRDAVRTHVAVLARPLGGSTVHAAVYPSLAAGEWTLWEPSTGAPALRVTVRDGEVTQASWPG